MVHYANYVTLHYTTTTTTTTLQHYTSTHYNYNYTTTTDHYNHNYNYATLHYTTLDYTTLHHSTSRKDLEKRLKACATFRSINRFALPSMSNSSQLQLRYTTLQLRLHNTTLHPAVVGDVKDQIATATIATSPRKHNSNHLSVNQWIRSAIRDSQQPTSPIGSYSETSTTALCGTTGSWLMLSIYSLSKIYLWLKELMKNINPGIERNNSYPSGSRLKWVPVYGHSCFVTYMVNPQPN